MLWAYRVSVLDAFQDKHFAIIIVIIIILLIRVLRRKNLFF